MAIRNFSETFHFKSLFCFVFWECLQHENSSSDKVLSLAWVVCTLPVHSPNWRDNPWGMQSKTHRNCKRVLSLSLSLALAFSLSLSSSPMLSLLLRAEDFTSSLPYDFLKPWLYCSLQLGNRKREGERRREGRRAFCWGNRGQCDYDSRPQPVSISWWTLYLQYHRTDRRQLAG